MPRMCSRCTFPIDENGEHTCQDEFSNIDPKRPKNTCSECRTTISDAKGTCDDCFKTMIANEGKTICDGYTNGEGVRRRTRCNKPIDKTVHACLICRRAEEDEANGVPGYY
ncbi:unnamed protein product [Penicillium bialowiezense]